MMPRVSLLSFAALVLTANVWPQPQPEVGTGAIKMEWKKHSSLPDHEGFAGTFAGVSNGFLCVAGGANFPDKRPWQGGKKVWYDAIYALDRPEGEWRRVGVLTRPLGYGVSVTHGESLIGVGGCDADRHYAEAFRLDWKAGTMKQTTLPSLPRPVAYACGALVGDLFFVVGGQEKPDSEATSRSVFQINLAAPKPQWRELEPCPGRGRMLAIAAAWDGAFWMVGGVDLVRSDTGKVERSYLKDGYRYDLEKGWRRIPDLPYPVVAAPSPAPNNGSGFFLLGGDDGSQTGVAPGDHRGFSKRILRYDPKVARWTEAGTLPAPRVTVPCVSWNRIWVIPSGELRPGIRSPEVWSVKWNEK